MHKSVATHHAHLQSHKLPQPEPPLLQTTSPKYHHHHHQRQALFTSCSTRYGSHIIFTGRSSFASSAISRLVLDKDGWFSEIWQKHFQASVLREKQRTVRRSTSLANGLIVNASMTLNFWQFTKSAEVQRWKFMWRRYSILKNVSRETLLFINMDIWGKPDIRYSIGDKSIIQI